MNILITGGASGLGEAITIRLASNEDDRIFFTFHKSSEKAQDLEKKYSNTKGIHCDFHIQADIDHLLELIENVNINVLINNAFTSDINPTHFHKMDPAVFTNNFDFNIIPVIRISQKAISHFRKNKYGKIINILSSVIIDNPPLGWSEYTAAKAYLASLSKSWAAENMAFNITSNSVSPSFMLTNLTINTDERLIEEIKENHPYNKLVTTDEVSEAVLFLSGCSQQINGINLIMNAGKHVI